MPTYYKKVVYVFFVSGILSSCIATSHNMRCDAMVRVVIVPKTVDKITTLCVDNFRRSISNLKNFEIIERDITELLTEAEFENFQGITAKDRVNLRIKNVQKIFIIETIKTDNFYYATVKLIDVETGLVNNQYTTEGYKKLNLLLWDLRNKAGSFFKKCY
jgi:hypothetical protein